jgi:hypothetical protein
MEMHCKCSKVKTMGKMSHFKCVILDFMQMGKMFRYVNPFCLPNIGNQCVFKKDAFKCVRMFFLP